MGRELSKQQQICRSVLKTYRKEIFNPFIEAVRRYELIEKDDKIAVCISGGKDSMLMAVLLQHLQQFSEVPFSLTFLSMDPGYNARNREKIIANAKLLGIPLTMFESDIFKVVDHVGGAPCYLCARMRRGHLYAKAKELGCNKIALGHHFSDVIETTLMGMLHGAQLQGMLPKLKSTNFAGMELIRPLYCVHEDAIIKWAKHNDLTFIRCACRMTEKTQTDLGASKRLEVKELIRTLKKENPLVEKNIFNAIHNVNVDTFVEYKMNGQRHSFLEKFKES